MTGSAGHRVAAASRSRLWAALFVLLGAGIRVTGPRPAGPCVVVANHASHADAPALLAALGSRSAPRVAAAADYWFANRWRRWLCRALIAGFPVRRGNGGSQDLAAAAAQLAAGRSVVVFAEGSRTRDGAVGAFRGGAFRLAADAGVPVVPAAILGTRSLLPVHGELRPCPVEVRFGEPVADASAGTVRAALVSLLDAGPAQPPVGRVWRALSRFTASPAALLTLFLWAAAEAVSWPVIAEFALVCVAGVARPRRVPLLVAALAAGSVTGIVVNVVLARHGIAAPWPLTTPAMHAAAQAQLRSHGASALWSQVMNGIPVKVYARSAGALHVPVWRVAAVAAITRTLRMAVLGAAVACVARLIRRPLMQCYGWMLVAFTAVFAAGLAIVISSWS